MWELSRDGITQSLLTDWLLCRERFRIKAFLGLIEDQGFDAKIEFGSMCHAGMEQIAKNGFHINRTANAIRDYSQRLMKRWPSDLDDIKFWMYAAIAVVRLHYKYWQTQDSRFNWVDVEMKFRHDYTLPSGRTLPLRGMMDGVVERKDGLWLLEHKCRGMIDETAIQDTMTKNFQITFYSQILRELFPDKKVAGVIYDVIRRPYGTIRQTKSESREQYGQRGIQRIEADPQDHFYRWEVQLTEEDLDEARNTIFHPILEQFMDWYEWVSVDWGTSPFREGNTIHYMRPFGMFDAHDWGNRGSYFDLMTTGQTVALTPVKTLFPELE